MTNYIYKVHTFDNDPHGFMDADGINDAGIVVGENSAGAFIYNNEIGRAHV